MKYAPIALTIAVTFVAPAGAVTLVNPSFEDLSASYVDLPGADRMTSVAPDGWTIALNSPDWFWGEGPAGLWHTPYGEHFAIGAATGFSGSAYREGIKQTVTDLSVGETYVISFSHANGLFYNPGTPGFYEGVGTPGGWQVLLDGGSILITSSTNDNSVAAPEHTATWDTSSVVFTAAATAHEIQFVAWKADGSQDPTFQFLDSVGVDEVVVPEPSSLALIALGMLCAGWRFGRNRR